MLNLTSFQTPKAFACLCAAIFAFILSLGGIPLPAQAQIYTSTDTLGWCTATGAGTQACFADPQEACEKQFDIYGSPMGSTGPASYSGTAYWYQMQCGWKQGVSAPFPSTVFFKCDPAHPEAIRLPPGKCVIEDPQLRCNCHEVNPTTAHPINIMTGAKMFEDTDFETADGTIVVKRKFVSLPFSGILANSLVSINTYQGNWMSNFFVSIQLGDSWDSSSVLGVMNSDGTAQNFVADANGNVSPYANSTYTIPNMGPRLQFVGTYPGKAAVKAGPSTWRYTDAYNNVWTLQTIQNQYTKAFDTGIPTQVTRPDGTVLTLQYDINGGLARVTDQHGKSISLTWNVREAKKADNTSVYEAATISSITLPGGYKINYTYDRWDGNPYTPQYAGRLSKVEYLDASGVVQDSKSYLYQNVNNPGLVTAIVDKNGVTRWTADYDGFARALYSKGPNGEFSSTVAYTADSRHYYRIVTDALGRQTTYTFDHATSVASGQLTSIAGAASTNAPAATSSYTYDTNGVWQTSTDEEGRVTKYQRNTAGQPTQVIEGYGTADARTTNYTWNSSFDLLSQSVAPGLTTTYGYDAQGKLTSITQVDTTTQTVPYSTAGQTRTWTYTWGTTGNAIGKLVSVDGPLAGTGDSISYTYNVNGYLATVTDQVGKVTTVSAWDWRGAPLTVSDPNSVQTTFTYDIHGRVLTATVNPGTSQKQFGFTYDAVGNLTKIILPTTGYLQYTYDTASRLTQITNDKNETVTLTPNANGQPTLSTTKTSGGTITQQQTLVYDELGRLIQTLGAASTTPTKLAYDKVDNLKTITDGRSKVTTNSFDALNRVITVTNPESQSVQYGYSPQDVVTSHKDGRNLQTTFVTNGFGDVIQEVSPDRGTRTYWYDLAGRMTKLVDGDNEETDFSYDNADRLLTKTFPGAAGETVTYTYDSVASGNIGNGRLTGVTEQSGSSAFTYDAFGRVTTDKKIIQGLTYNVVYAYDKNDRITQITLPSGRVVSFTRDNDGLITAVTTKPTSTGTVSNVATSISYQPFGPLKSLTYGNGLTLTKNYNTNYWLTQIQVKNGTTALFDLGYQYYDDGRLGEIDDNAATGRTVFMSLTDSGRLSYASGPWGQESYSWDAAGNRIGDYLTVGSTTTADNEITAGNSNRLVQTQDNNGVAKRNLTYRTGGDLYQDATVGGTTYTYAYNARKRLVQVSAGASVAATYGYDFLDQRVWRSVTGQMPIHYIFDQSGHLLAEHNGNTGAVIREYIWIDDMPIAVIDKSSGTAVTYYIHTGHLNEPQVMTNASKAKVWDAYMTPFGKAKVFTTATANVDIRLPGQWFQAEAAGAGLNQNNFRDYDPSLGRYIEADPIGLNGGQNPYAYVNGQVYDLTDKQGLIPNPYELSCVDPVQPVCWGAAGADLLGDGLLVWRVVHMAKPQPVTTSRARTCGDAHSTGNSHCDFLYKQEMDYCRRKYGPVQGQFIRCKARADQNWDLCLQGKDTLPWWSDMAEDGWEAKRPMPRKPGKGK